MRILNGCAKSKFIADAFTELGWDAWTCDLLPPEGAGKHIQDDIRNHFNDGWDMAIFHPECTFLANSGVRWLHERPERWMMMIEAAAFFNECLNSPIPRICVENPIQHKYARELIRPPDQIVQPYWFGEGETKATCLWLIGLPPLLATLVHTGREGRVWKEPPSPERKANRSRTYQGMAIAMAKQWGQFPTPQ